MYSKLRKILCVFTVFLSISAWSFAGTSERVSAAEDEGASKAGGISFGTFALLQSRKSGGGLTFAFPVFSKGDFFIRDEVTASLYLANDFGTDGMLISVGDKLHFGCLRHIAGFCFRTYGYMKCEVGACKDISYAFFQAPMILELGGAGGFEFLFRPSQGFFVEFGGGASITSFGGSAGVSRTEIASGNFCGGYVCLTTGFKHYF